MSKKDETVEIYLLEGPGGTAVVMNDHRICGPKGFGQGRVGERWRAKRSEILAALGINKKELAPIGEKCNRCGGFHNNSCPDPR